MSTKKAMDTHNSVAVIGGGAAGLMAAVWAARSGADVTVFEKNKFPARKLRITGKGRCNVTNDCTPDEMLREVTKNAKFLYSSVYAFPPEDVKSFFESLGVSLKTERGRRVFPVSDKASDVSDALIKEAEKCNVRFVTSKITGITAEGGNVRGVEDFAGFHPFDAVILATGGVSYPLTGSTGDGHKMAKALDIEVTELSPSLVPICCRDNTAEMMGLTLKNVKFNVTYGKKTVFSELGEMLFTHFGVSGPLVLSASAHLGEHPLQEYSAGIDLKPALDAETLDKRLQSDLKKYAARNIINSMGDLLPKGLIPSVIRRSGIPEHTKCSAVTKEMRRNLLAILKNYTLTMTAFRPIDEAIITRGGISVKEISPSTMMSKKYGGLFFAGEIIDADAYTGGYNLQIAWSTGKKAGLSAAEYIGISQFE